jgi:ABC-type glycerol-3-phosphate transport system substrate-binding protein
MRAYACINIFFLLEENMKRFFSAAALLALVVSLAFAGGEQGGGSGGAGTAGGLSVVKAFGTNREYVVQGKNINFSDWYEGKVPSRLWDRLVADLAGYGIKLEIETVMSDQMETALQTMLASGKLNDYDFVNIGSGDEKIFQGLYDQGRMYSLNKGIEQYSTGNARAFFYNDDAGQFFRKMETLEDGNFYWLTPMMGLYYKDPDNDRGCKMAGQLRYDWLQALGLKIPTTLVEFTNVLTAFQQNDMNKNGIRDEVAAFPMDGFSTGVAQWFGLAGDLVAAVDYKAVSPWYQAHVQDYIKYVNQLYKAGLIQVDTEGGAMQANRIAYQYQWDVATWDEPNVNVPPGAEKAYFAPFVIKALPDTEPRVWEQAGRMRPFFPHFIPARAKNVEGAIKLIDYLVSDEYATLTELGIEGYTFKMNNGLPEFILSNPNNVGIDSEFMSSGLPALWCNGSILPRRKVADIRRDMQQIRIEGYDLKSEFAERVTEGPYLLNQDTGTLLAFPTSREMERIQAIRPDLNTYSSELLTSLIMGEKSLDNWNTYMGDLKRLGLDELISIYQARIDRGR